MMIRRSIQTDRSSIYLHLTHHESPVLDLGKRDFECAQQCLIENFSAWCESGTSSSYFFFLSAKSKEDESIMVSESSRGRCEHSSKMS